MTTTDSVLRLPEHVSQERRDVLHEVAARNLEDHGDDLVAMVLSGSVGRGLATSSSDVDVYVVLTEQGAAGRRTRHSDVVDEIPVPVRELDDLPVFGTEGWYRRWSFAWAPVLLDRSGGRVADAVRRQASVDAVEAESILLEHDRLDGWLNYAYRALKNDRDGRPLERRLDAAESVPWLLDVVFSLAGRVRPYHKYLPWELRTHPLPGWEAERLLGLVVGTLDGDPAAVRETYSEVVARCSAFDAERPRPVLGPVVDAWGDELKLFRT
ncbi:nucleotidyltransferase domain-containing protein [uncultured Nocardioides sp.]|uniref:nucleotidyltransferase domain-containing protein n=1 Tax=uncultured Nocardioides sp. TaxID=198441 RepID=UPI0030F83394